MINRNNARDMKNRNMEAKNGLAGYRQTTGPIQKFAPLTLRKPSYMGQNVGVNVNCHGLCGPRLERGRS